MLADSAANLEEELVALFSSTLAVDLESAYLNGPGVLTPRGILTYADAGITSVNIGTSPNITYAGLVDLFTALPSQYLPNAKFVMNRATYAKLLKLAGSTNDHPLFQAGLLLQQLWGKEIILSDFMPNVGANAYPVLFGDFSYYRAVDRQGIEIIRLQERFTPHIGLQPYGRFGGDVSIFNAFRVGKTS